MSYCSQKKKQQKKNSNSQFLQVNHSGGIAVNAPLGEKEEKLSSVTNWKKAEKTK